MSKKSSDGTKIPKFKLKKKPTENGVESEKVKKEKKKLNFDINIKLQLLFGFAIPVIFVILVGVISYNKAEEGMIANYEIATQNTIDTEMEYLDFGFSLIRGDISQLKLDSELQSLVGGTYKLDKAKASAVINKTSSNILIKQTFNGFIYNIYIVPKSDQDVITTSKKSTANGYHEYGYYEEWSKTEEGKAIIEAKNTTWISNHSEMDKLTELNPEEYV